MGAPRNVFLSGEGPNELGGWSSERQYRPATKDPGVLEALLRRVVADGWSVVDARRWKDIPSLTPGPDGIEARRTRGVFQLARDAGCDAVVFSIDRDEPRNATREVDVAVAIREEEQRIDALSVAGGVAVEKLEAWVLALRGRRSSESIALPQDTLTEEFGIPKKDTAAMVTAVDEADMHAVPDDARSLRAWIDAATRAFAGRDA